MSDPPTCEWKASDDYDAEYWESACGETWTFRDGGPVENHARYCHGCGKPIVLTQRASVVEEDDE